MQVLDVSVNTIQADVKKKTENVNCNQNRSSANVFLTRFQNKKDISEKEIFDFIREWKEFCHKKIVKDNIDYIA